MKLMIPTDNFFLKFYLYSRKKTKLSICLPKMVYRKDAYRHALSLMLVKVTTYRFCAEGYDALKCKYRK